MTYQRFSLSYPQSFKSFFFHRQGLFDNATVSWRLSAGSTIDSTDISNAVGETIHFLPGVGRMAFQITINDDNIPEADEQFAIELYNPTGGYCFSAVKIAKKSSKLLRPFFPRLAIPWFIFYGNPS